MAAGHGQEHYMGFVVESTYGTPVTPPTLFAEVSTDTIKPERGLTQKPELRNTSNVTSVPNKQKVTGGLSAQMPWDGLGTLLKWALGTSTPTGSGPYTHAIARTRALPIFTAYSSRDQAAIGGSSVDQWVSCVITKLSLKQDREEPLMLSLELMGQKRNKVAVLTPTFVVKDVIHWTHFTHLMMDADGSALVLPARSFEWTIENPVFDDHYKLGSASPTGVNRSGPAKVTMSAELEYDSLAEQVVFDGDTPHDWQIKWDGTANQHLQIDMPKFYMNELDNPVNDSGAIISSISGHADQSAAELDEVTISLKNATATI